MSSRSRCQCSTPRKGTGCCFRIVTSIKLLDQVRLARGFHLSFFDRPHHLQPAGGRDEGCCYGQTGVQQGGQRLGGDLGAEPGACRSVDTWRLVPPAERARDGRVGSQGTLKGTYRVYSTCIRIPGLRAHTGGP